MKTILTTVALTAILVLTAAAAAVAKPTDDIAMSVADTHDELGRCYRELTVTGIPGNLGDARYWVGDIPAMTGEPAGNRGDWGFTSSAHYQSPSGHQVGTVRLQLLRSNGNPAFDTGYVNVGAC